MVRSGQSWPCATAKSGQPRDIVHRLEAGELVSLGQQESPAEQSAVDGKRHHPQACLAVRGGHRPADVERPRFDQAQDALLMCPDRVGLQRDIPARRRERRPQHLQGIVTPWIVLALCRGVAERAGCFGRQGMGTEACQQREGGDEPDHGAASLRIALRAVKPACPAAVRAPRGPRRGSLPSRPAWPSGTAARRCCRS